MRRRKTANRFLQRLAMFLLLIVICNDEARAFRLTDVTKLGLGIARWDAAPHFVDGQERSLDGGLRYSLQGGSYEAYRDLLQWSGTPPTVSEIQNAFETAFAVWEEMDPATGLGTELRFVPDFGTPVFAEPPPTEVDGYFKLNRGAEIDFLAAGSDVVFDLGRADIYGDPSANSVTLTSGVSGYPAAVLSGADIYLSTEKVWRLDLFLEVISHEVGHAILLHDVDVAPDILEGDCCVSKFYDDNYDDTSHSTVRKTLNNSFAHLIDPLDPDNSPALDLYDVCYPEIEFDVFSHCSGSPGIDTPGVDLKMESTPNRKTPVPLQNDDFAGRQFLYPFVRTPGDFNADRSLTAEDIDLLTAEIAVRRPRWWFDLNEDGVVDHGDRSVWVSDLKQTFLGDADLNKEVEFADFLSLSNSFGNSGGWANGDFDGNGSVEFADFLVLSENFGASNANVATVPEPSCHLLVLLGLASSLGLRQRPVRLARTPCR